jgi:alpha-L-rhamnosidase
MRKLLTYCLFTLVCLSVQAQTQVKDLTIEHLMNPLGIDRQQPRFSWQLKSNTRNVTQSGYELKVGTDENKGQVKNIIWQTGKVKSDESIHIQYNGPNLQSGKKYYWQVKVWDNSGKPSAWSHIAFWQMGLLKTSDWKASWIEPGYEETENLQPSPMLRKTFTITKKISSATAYITAHGLYEAHLNGKRIGIDYLTPGWTSYEHRLQYQQYDVTQMLMNGDNAIGVILGSGWYRSPLADIENKNIWGKTVGLLLQISITYTDGSQDLIVSDGSWKSSTGSITESEIYHGETIDSRKEKTGWLSPQYNDKDWYSVKVASYDNSNLIATYNEPIRKQEVIKPVKVLITPMGEKVIDFGQNLVGWEVVKLRGQKGDTIRIYHAEVLDKEGNFYTANLRDAKATSTYILSGNGEEVFEPRFTFYGYRYIKIEGLRGEVNPDDFTSVVLHSAMPLTGTFSTSNSLINQLQKNIIWGQKGNFIDVPIDCPQRDERLGWTGDAQVFFRTAAFNMGVNNFFSKWLKDLAADQMPSGKVHSVVPDVMKRDEGGSAGWGDAATIIPWNMYMAYADKVTLEQQFPSMKAWVDFITDNSKNHLWNTGTHFGDWLFYSPENDRRGNAAVTDRHYIAQCFYAYSIQLLINAAEVIGKEDDVASYKELLRNVKDAYLKEYVSPNGRIASGTQTSYVLALEFDMLPEYMRKQAAERLVENIRSYKDHLTTGFLGTPYLCNVLSRFGYSDVAYTLLLQETYPSWLYPVKMGATTIWERWDGIKTDSTFQVVSMNSLNHYAYGAIGDWMYRNITGLREAAPGYKKIIIQPHIGGDLTWASADLDTYYGKVSSHWKSENGILQMDIEIPANTTAQIYIPADSVNNINESGRSILSVKDIKVIGESNGFIIVESGSGKFSFSILNRM